jgi:hypothetical protein
MLNLTLGYNNQGLVSLTFNCTCFVIVYHINSNELTMYMINTFKSPSDVNIMAHLDLHSQIWKLYIS